MHRRHMPLHLLLCVFECILLAGALASTIYGQAAGGSIQGRVEDASGGIIPKATVAITDLSTGVVREFTTNGDGIYLAPNLKPALYEVKISAQGFTPRVQQVEISVGTSAEMNATLSVAGTGAKVEVSGTANVVDTTDSTISEVVTGSIIRDLPLNGRSWTDLATLEPGVEAIKTEQSLNLRAQHGFGTEMTISGGRPQQNSYRLNGININDYSNAAPGSVLGVAMGVDAIQEFSVITANYSAAYGRTSGGVVNAVTRSGTNQLHGSAYEFLRNDVLDAKNFFDVKKLPFKRNQFGASGGGPIKKDKTFFFLNYEGLRQSFGLTENSLTPSAAARAGNLATGPVTVNPAVTRFLNAFYPLPNDGLVGNGDTGIYLVSGQQITTENYVTSRIDHTFSKHDFLNGTYTHDTSTSSQPDEFNSKRFGLDAGQQIVTIEEGHTFGSSLVNSARLGYNRSRGEDGLVTQVINPAMSDTTYGFVPNKPVGLLTVTGLATLTGGANAAGIAPHHFIQNSVQAYDDLFWTHGKHQLSFGADIEDTRVYSLIGSYPGGSFAFTSLSNFLTNNAFQATFVFDPSQLFIPRDVRELIFGTYVQDDWHVSRKLVANIGLRYEMSTVPSERNGRQATLINITDAQPHLGNPYFSNPTLRNFEPRIGLAWDPIGDGKTAIRSAFGMFDVLPLAYLFQILTPFAAPFYEQANISSLPTGSFPTQAFQLAVPTPAILRMSYIEPHPKRDYVMVWNLNAQRELTPTVSTTIGYVGSRGVHQPWTDNDGDMVIPTLTPQGYVWPSKATSQKINANWGRIAMKLWQTNSFYDALQARLLVKTHALLIQASYTFGKSIDNSSTSEADNGFANSISNPYWFAPQTNRGLSDFNIAHDLVIHGIWNIPTPGSHSYERALLGGWRLGGTYTFTTGVPFNMFLAGDPVGLKSNQPSELPSIIPGCGPLTTGNPLAYVNMNCLEFPNPSNSLGTLGRNVLIGPRLSDFDVSLDKDFRLTERFTLQFRTESFNVLNHPNFAPPIDNDTAFTSTGSRVGAAGRIDALQTSGREIQFALKLIF